MRPLLPLMLLSLLHRLKRAGLDYWQHVCVKVHDSWEVRQAPDASCCTSGLEGWHCEGGPSKLASDAKFIAAHRHQCAWAQLSPGMHKVSSLILCSALSHPSLRTDFATGGFAALCWVYSAVVSLMLDAHTRFSHPLLTLTAHTHSSKAAP